MSLNDWKEDSQSKLVGDQEKPLNDGMSAESQQDVDFWDHSQNGVVENEVEVVAEAVEIQEAVEHPEMPSEKNEKKAKRKKDKAKKKKNKAEDLNAPDLLGTNKGVETM